MSQRVREIVAVFLFSMALLALELAYTKILSVVLWYHFGFLMVSTAMLGFAASGVVLAFVRHRAHRLNLFQLISASAVATVVTYVLFNQSNATEVGLSVTTGTVVLLALVTLLLVVPFFFIGFTITWIIWSRRENVGAIYGSNLMGSAAGALLFIALFDYLPGEIAVFVVTLVMLSAAALVIPSTRSAVAWVALTAFVVPLLFMGDAFPVEPPRIKWLGVLKNREQNVVYSGWSSLSKVDVFRDPDKNLRPGIGLWGISQNFPGPLPERYGVAIDSGALTTILRYPQSLDSFAYMPSFLIHHIGREYGSSLHIGAGGGIDLLAAHHYGIPDVSGVEINSLIVDQVKSRFDDWSGGVYTGGVEGVAVHVGEGRSFLERTDKTYDLVQLSGVDTSSSSQAGAFALAENYLYTVEAFRSYLEHLSPDGILTLARWHMPDKQGRKTFSLRLVNLVRDSLLSMGLDPRGRVLLFREAPRGYLAIVVVKKEPFSEDELERSLAFVEKLGGVPMVVPGEERGNVYEKFLYASPEQHRALLSSYPYRVNAPTDDSPFFFELQRMSNAFRLRRGVGGPLALTGQETLLLLLVELAVLGALMLGVPLFVLARSRGVRVPKTSLAYFSLIGLAYITIEIALSQKLVLYLGHPTYALSVVLAGVLFFSGLGSFASARVPKGSEPRVLLVLLGVLIAIGVVLTPILDASLESSFGTRLFLTSALIAPLGFLMGFPMPMALSRIREETVPFLWGVNGFFSVVGSVLTVILSINAGFVTVFLVATTAYLGAALLLRRISATA